MPLPVALSSLALLSAAPVGDACVSAAEHAHVQELLRTLDPPRQGPRIMPKFAWPLAPTAQFKDFGYHVITNHVDHDPGPGLRDFRCGARTYDGHTGTDIALWPFLWNMMDAEVIDVVAAAPGKIVFVHDGEYDRNCAAADIPANAVGIQHADGSSSWYHHLKKGSVKVQKDQLVQTGHVLGKVGSSGSSTGPHLHFSAYDPANKLIDPFYSANPDCNELNNASWWADQLPYHLPQVHKLMTSRQAYVEPQTCGEPTVLHDSDKFCPGDDILFYRFLSDHDAPTDITVTVRDATDAVFFAVQQQVPISMGFGWYNKKILPPKAALGQWTMTLTHLGVDYTHPFTVDLAGCPPLPCDGPWDCPEDQVCSAGECTPGECIDDDDCDIAEICQPETLTCVPAPNDSTGAMTTGTTDPDTSSTSGDSSGDSTSMDTTSGAPEGDSTGGDSTSGDSTGGSTSGDATDDSTSSDSSTGDSTSADTTTAVAADTTTDATVTTGEATTAASEFSTSGSPVPTTGYTTDPTTGGVTTDDEDPPQHGELDVACACTSDPRGAAPLAALLLLGMRRRRRAPRP